MKRTIILSLLALFLTGSLLAQPGRGIGRGLYTEMGRGEYRPMLGRYHSFDYLDLNEEQQERIDQLYTDHLKKIDPVRDKLAEKQISLQNSRTADNVDMKSLNSLIEEVGDLHIELMKKREAYYQQIRTLLTDEQRAVFDSHYQRNYEDGLGYGYGYGRGYGHGYGSLNNYDYGYGRGRHPVRKFDRGAGRGRGRYDYGRYRRW